MVRSVDGQGFAFEPRSMVEQPKAFGLVPSPISPADGVHMSEHRYRAAMVQHLMAASVRAELLKTTGKSPAEYVADVQERGLGQDRVRRVFRGETMAQVTDLAFWGAQFPEVAGVISAYIESWSSEKEADPDVDRDPVSKPRVGASAPPVHVASEAAPESGEAAPSSSAEDRGASSRAAQLRAESAAVRAGRKTPQNPFGSSARRIR